MTSEQIKIIVASPIGYVIGVLFKMIICSFAVTGGIHLFDFKTLNPFFSIRRVASIFLLTFGIVYIFDMLF